MWLPTKLALVNQDHFFSQHHAMPQHETKDSDLKTMPLLAFHKKVVKDPRKTSFWVHYQVLARLIIPLKPVPIVVDEVSMKSV